MTEREAFIEAIAANPYEDTPRLVFADWLQEHGEEDRAEFVRLAHEMCGRRKELGWPSPPPRELQELQKRVQGSLELHGPDWLNPFCRALGVPPPARRQRWTSRLWHRVSGKSRDAAFSFNSFKGILHDYVRVDGWSNAPINAFSLYHGFVTQLAISIQSPPIPDLAAAFRLEPVHNLSIEVSGNSTGWQRLNSPCLSRIRNLTVTVSGSEAVRTNTTFEEICWGENWLGVDDFRLDGDLDHPLDHYYFERLAHSPFLSGLHSLSVTVDFPDLRPLTTCARIANLRSFRAFGRRMPSDTTDLIANAVFRPNLEELDLSLAHLGDTAVGRLGLFTWPKLHTLDLACSEITDAGVHELLPLVPQLLHLDLGWNAITDAGALALAEAIDYEKLESLSLHHNPLSPAVVATLRERFGERFCFWTRGEDGLGS